VLVLVGSGSTAPAALYSRWAEEYNKRNRLLQVRYLPSSTGEGITLIALGVSDFGAGEARLTDKERNDSGLLELPVAVATIVPIYNLPDVHQNLRLSGEVLAEIYLGEVKSWNAPQIAKLNPEIVLPNLPIQVVNRPAGRGSNYIFTEFLAKVNLRFRMQVRVSASPKWPIGAPAQRSSDMVDKVKNTVGSIGFVEYHYAVRAAIQQAAVLNSAGQFVSPSVQTIGAACNAVEALQQHGFSASLTNAPGKASYPVTGFTWLYVRTKSTDAARTIALNEFLNWIYADGQQFSTQEDYPVLPSSLLSNLRKTVKASMTGNSQPAENRPAGH
jgi:phosphate transport system substrate-binding protein